MAIDDTKPEPGFQFLPEYSDLIANAANRWAFLEYHVIASIWQLTDLTPAMGACLTSQMYTFNAKLSALLSLLKLRKAPKSIIDSVNKFADCVRDALEARNRAVHDVWLNDNLKPEQMGKLRITAEKILRMGIEEINVEQLKNDVAIIKKRQAQMLEIRKAIEAAIPTLPEMSVSELYPIEETQKVR